MKINHNFSVAQGISFCSGDLNINHPTSSSVMTQIDNMTIIMGAFPATVDTPETICLSVHIDGVQFNIFSGTKEEVINFCKKFPRR